MTRKLTFLLLATALGGGSATWAQAPAPATAAAEADGGIEDIIVTARKRAETVQDVPIAVTAFSAEGLERQQIRSVEDLNFSAPNLNIVKNVSTTNAAQIYIRGLGQDESTFHAEQPVTVYIDGVALGKANGALLDLIDFERIEVLRGPQGSLYGRNSAGGAIKFVTRRPELESTRVIADATIGTFDRIDFRASASAPVVEGSLGIKLDVISRKDDGYVTNLTNGETVNATDRQTVRGSALWKPTTATTIYATVDYTKDDSSINLAVPYSLVNGQPVDLFGKYAARTARPDINSYDGTGGSLEISHDLGGATLMALTGYRRFKSILAADLDGRDATTLDFTQDLRQNQFSQELQLTSNGDGSLQYVAGLFYYRERVHQAADNILQNTLNDNVQISRSYAAYGELTFNIGERFAISAGGRYTKDKKTMDAAANNRTTGALLFDVNGRFSSSQFTPRVLATYKPSDDVMAYASWSKGYQSGGFANGRPTNSAQALLTFDPQKATAYEAGLKTEFLDRRARVNVAIFNNDFKNIGFSFLNGTQLTIATANVRIRGAEFEATFVPTDGLNLYANYAHLDGKYKKIPINPATGLSTVAGLTLQSKLKHVPDDSYKIGFDYTLKTGGSLNLGLGANYAYSSLIFRNLGNNPAIASPAEGFFDAQAFVETSDGRWRLTLAGRNLGDEYYNYQGVSGQTRYYLPGRTWSLTLRAQL